LESRISERVLGISPSATESTSFLANKMIEEGIDVISFAQGEPDFDTPQNISRAAKNAIDEGYTRYTDVPGIPAIRKAISKKFKISNGIDYDASEVIISNGGKQVLYLLFQTICDLGDKVLIPTPSYVSYEEQVKLAGATPIFSPTDPNNNFRLTRKDIESHLTPHTKAIIINSPNNPTGAICQENELRAIADLALERDIYIVTDEVYEHLLYDSRNHFSIASIGGDIKDIVITVNSVSKTYAMTGWRVGYAGGPKDIIDGMIKLQGHVSGNVNSISQVATLEAINGPQNAISNMLEVYAKRRDLMVDRINSIKGLKCKKPDGAFYLFTDVTDLYGREWSEGVIRNDLDVATFFLKEAHVAVVPGAAFRFPGYVRFVFAKSEKEIIDGLKRIEKVIPM